MGHWNGPIGLAAGSMQDRSILCEPGVLEVGYGPRILFAHDESLCHVVCC